MVIVVELGVPKVTLPSLSVIAALINTVFPSANHVVGLSAEPSNSAAVT